MVRARAPGRDHGFAAALLAGAAAWGAHTFVDWDWDIPGVTVPALIFLGVLAARPPGTPRDRAGAGPPPGRGLALALGVAAAAVVMALAALPAISKQLTSDALSQASENTEAALTEAGEKAALAKRLNPFAVEPVFAQAAIAERGNQASAAAELLVDAAERQPDNPSAWLRLGRFQVLVDDSPGALRSLLTAARLDPAAAGIYFLLLYANYDERRSASATGTPLPLPSPETPVLPFLLPPVAGAPGAGAPPAAQPPSAPAPAPAPTPAPAPDPTPAPPREPAPPPPSGDPFRLEG
jgi:hypothetical protein